MEARIAKDIETYQQRPKRRFVGARAEEYRFARYVEDWRAKIERVGNLNYPEAARELKLYGSLLITVSIRSDGSVENVEINRSSGQKVLDAAAIRIVEMSAPFAVFPRTSSATPTSCTSRARGCSRRATSSVANERGGRASASQGRLRERGEAQARRACPRARAAAETHCFRVYDRSAEAATKSASPSD
jgi:TonB family protein